MDLSIIAVQRFYQMTLSNIIQQPEGRRLEFKEELPANTDLAKAIIAFANDAGGELFIGIKDDPRVVIGVNEEDLLQTEEKISNIVHDNCSPVILPDISFLRHENRYVIRIQIHKGNNPPYHLKSKGVVNGTYLRVGSSNRLADKEIIAGLERQKRGISFDGELVYEKDIDQLDLNSLVNHYKEITGENIDETVLMKLDLFGEDQGKRFPSNAMILLSDDRLRLRLFPYAKIECARFKGTVPGNFIDQKTIGSNVSLQAELAYQFVLRHISQGSEYEGVYRKDRWEYPAIAIREIIRNSVIHRDYSLRGKDIKIAVFDDKIEVTSPGKLLPTVDFNDMESGQSDIRNKTLAPVFKRLGIIEQWGNGLQLIADELKEYPGIDFIWSEPGISFRAAFIKRGLKGQQESQQELRPITVDYGRLRSITVDYGRLSIEEKKILLHLLDNKEITRKEVISLLNLGRTKVDALFSALLEKELLERKGQGRSTYYVVSKKEDKG